MVASLPLSFRQHQEDSVRSFTLLNPETAKAFNGCVGIATLNPTPA